MSSRIIRGQAGSLPVHSWQGTANSAPGPVSYPVASQMPSDAGGIAGGNGRSSQGDVDEIRAQVMQEFQARLERERGAAFAAGRAAAEDAARRDVQGHYERLARSVDELARCRAQYRQETEREVVHLALEIARRILHRELTVAPEAILGLVHAGLESVSLREVLEVRTHPAHAEIVRAALQASGAPAGIAVTADPHLEPGAVLVETRRGGFDASVGAQIEEIERGFADLMEKGAPR